jgi:hypothetical protein
MRSFLCLTFALTSLASLSCDGSSTGNNVSTSCPAFTACGGDLTGTWKIASVCSKGASTPTSTCSAQSTPTNARYDGTFTFEIGGTYQQSISVRGSTKLTYSASCFTSSAFTCEALDTELKSAEAAAVGFTGSCASSSDGSCVCNETMDMTFAEAGNYTVSGSSVTLTATTSSPGDGGGEFDYCVQGNNLTLQINDTTGAPTGALFLTK